MVRSLSKHSALPSMSECDFALSEDMKPRRDSLQSEARTGADNRPRARQRFTTELDGLASVLVELSYHGNLLHRSSSPDFPEGTAEVAQTILDVNLSEGATHD